MKQKSILIIGVIIVIVGILLLIRNINYKRADEIIKIFKEIINEEKVDEELIKLDYLKDLNNSCKKYFSNFNIENSDNYKVKAEVKQYSMPIFNGDNATLYIEYSKSCILDNEDSNNQVAEKVHIKVKAKYEKNKWIITKVES